MLLYSETLIVTAVMLLDDIECRAACALSARLQERAFQSDLWLDCHVLVVMTTHKVSFLKHIEASVVDSNAA